MARKPVIVMRFGAAHNTISVMGTDYDRGALERAGKYDQFRGQVRNALSKAGFFKRAAKAA